MIEVTQWFLKDEIWHAFHLSGPAALCGEVNIAYGVDPIADVPPSDGTTHDGCVAAINGEPAPEPAPKKKTKRK